MLDSWTSRSEDPGMGVATVGRPSDDHRLFSRLNLPITQAGDHEGHDFYISRSDYGCCDCGDAWGSQCFPGPKGPVFFFAAGRGREGEPGEKDSTHHRLVTMVTGFDIWINLVFVSASKTTGKKSVVVGPQQVSIDL